LFCNSLSYDAWLVCNSFWCPPTSLISSWYVNLFTWKL